MSLSVSLSCCRFWRILISALSCHRAGLSAIFREITFLASLTTPQARIKTKEDIFDAFRLGPIVMGILNLTPDSFSDGGLYTAHDTALDRALTMQREGALLIDVGAESTRPTATPISAEEEIARLRPILPRLCDTLNVPVSVDTYKADVAKWAITQGATIINDVWGLQRDPIMAQIIAETGAGVVIMHNRHEADESIDILEDIKRFFEKSLSLAETAGIASGAIILDPGIGFGKTLEQNYTILKNMAQFKVFERPILLGLSRKSMIGKLLNVDHTERLAGTLAANCFALPQGVDILRVHDVLAHVHAIEVFKAMMASR